MGTTAEKLQKLISTKAAIKTSLENKGLTPTDKFDTYPALIDSISGGGSGDVDIDFIASEDISVGDKVYLPIMPRETFDGTTYNKVAANTYCSTSSNNQSVYYYDSISNTKINTSYASPDTGGTRIRGYFLDSTSDKCIKTIESKGDRDTNYKYTTTVSVVLTDNIVTGTPVTLASAALYNATKSGGTYAYVVRLTNVKFLILAGVTADVGSPSTVVKVVTLDETLSSIASQQTIASSSVADTYVKYIYRYGKNQFQIKLNGSVTKNIKFSDDFSEFSEETSTTGPYDTNMSYYTDIRYCDGIYSAKNIYYKKDGIKKKASTTLVDLYNCLNIYKDNKFYIKITGINRTLVPLLSDSDISAYQQYYPQVVIKTNVVKSGGIFVGYAKTSATAGNNVTVSMVADYILDTEDVQ